MISYLEKFLKARLAIELRLMRQENEATCPEKNPMKRLREFSISSREFDTARVMTRTHTSDYSG